MYFTQLFVTLVAFVAISECRLLSVIVMHRHGDRTPTGSFPNDPHQCFWKQGFGALTEEGLQRMRKLGETLRKRYRIILPEKSGLEVRSSRSERCVKSVQSLIDGLYEDDFLEAPIPIISPPKRHDNMLYPESICPMYILRVWEIMQNPENLKWVNESMPFWQFLSSKTGLNINYINVVAEVAVWRLYDMFKIQRQFNLTLPDWVDNEVIRKLHDDTLHTLKILYNSPSLQRLRTSQFLSAVRGHIEAIENNEAYKPIKIYSTHDSVVAATLMSLNVFNDQLPPFGASIVFEIHRRERLYVDSKTPDLENKHFIKAYYFNGTTSADFHPLNLPECKSSKSCSFEKFKQIINPLIPDDWDEECKADPHLVEELMEKFSKRT